MNRRFRRFLRLLTLTLTGSAAVATDPLLFAAPPVQPAFGTAQQFTTGGQNVVRVVASEVRAVQTNGSGPYVDQRFPISFSRTGSQDVVEADGASKTITIKRGNASGSTFTDFVITTDYTATDLAVGDLNGDLLPDIVVAEEGIVVVYINDYDSSATTNPNHDLRFSGGKIYIATNAQGVDVPVRAIALANLNQFRSTLYRDIVGVGNVFDSIAQENTGYLLRFPNPFTGAAPREADVYPLPRAVSSVAAGDLNDDGFADLVVGSLTFGGVTVMKNQPVNPAAPLGDRTIDPSMTSPVSFGTSAIVSLAIGDIAANGKPAVLALAGYRGTIMQNGQPVPAATSVLALFTNDGTGALKDEGAITLNGGAPSTTGVDGNIAIGDLNGDGKPGEIAIVDGLDEKVWIVVADPEIAAQGFSFLSSATSISAAAPARRIDIGDLNKDNKLDLFTANGNANSASLLLNGASGGGGGATTLRIEETITSTSDPSGKVVRAGDKLTVKLTFANTGTAKAKSLQVATLVPQYRPAQDTTGIARQFVESDFSTISPGGKIVNVATLISTGTQWVLPGGDVVAPLDAQGKPNQAIVWDVGDLAPNFQQFVAYTLNITSAVLVPSAILRNNIYEVFSTVNEPSLAADEKTSHATLLGVEVRGPISLTVVPGATTVAPGGYITYTLKLDNFSGTAAPNAAAVFTIPANTRFAGFGLDKKGHPVDRPAGGVRSVLVQHSGSPGELLLYIGKIAARKSATISVTVQAQWAEPSEVPNQRIEAVEYAGAFLNATAIRDLLGAFTNPGAISYFQFLKDPARSVAATFNDNGSLFTSVQGTTENGPVLGLLKALSNRPTDTDTDDNGDAVDKVHPGQEITFFLALSNTGNSAAEEVYVSDGLPEHTQFRSVKFLGKVSSADKKDLYVVQDPDGRHIRFEGIRLDAHDFAVIEYTVQVTSDAPLGSFITPAAHIDMATGFSVPATIGSGSTPHTTGGFYINGPIKVVGDGLFAAPIVRVLVPRPSVSSDVAATVNTLQALYTKSPSALPLTNPADPNSYIRGVERYYIHYENGGKFDATGATLEFPLPAHTAFYRASFVDLPDSADKGALGLLPGKLIKTPSSSTIVPPVGGDLARSGTVNFTFKTVPAGKGGDVMVEVIVAPDVVQSAGSLVGDTDSPIIIHDSTVPAQTLRLTQKAKLPFVGAHLAEAASYVLPLDASYLAAPVPTLGILKWISSPVVKAGDTFQVQLVVVNRGDSDASPIAELTIPENTEFVSADAGQSFLLLPSANGPGNLVQAKLASNNGPIYPSGDPRSDLSPLHAHSAAALTVTLRATGAVGSQIIESSSNAIADKTGRVYASPTTTTIGTSTSAKGIFAPTGCVLNHQIINKADVFLIDLGGGNLIAAGAGNLIAAGAGNLIAAGAGNLIAAGAGNLINIGSSTALSALQNQANLVAAGAGNIIVPQGETLIAAGAGNLVAAGAGNLKMGDGGKLIAAGAGNLSVTGGGTLIAAGAGNLVAAGAGNLIAAGAGNLIAAGGGNLIAAGAGNILSSTGNSSALIQTSAGTLIAAGAGNFIKGN